MESATAFLRSITTAEKEIAISMFEPAHFVEQTHPLVKQLATALSKTTGKKTIFVQKPGAADARFYSSLGTPAPILGLQGEGLHGDNEYVELSSLASYHQTLTTFLNTLKI